MDCPARQLCDYFTSTILLTTEVCGTIPRATITTTNLMQWHETICIVKVFLLSEREISPKYTGIFLHFVHGFGSYVKGLPKTKRCNSVAVTVSVRIRCICETALNGTQGEVGVSKKKKKKKKKNFFFFKGDSFSFCHHTNASCGDIIRQSTTTASCFSFH